MKITLHRKAPWNRELRLYKQVWRNWFVQAGERFFYIEGSHGRRPVWVVNEIKEDGAFIGCVAHCFNLPAARGAITDLLNGLSSDEIIRNAVNAPAAGTGRNHPANVAARKARTNR